MSISSRRFVSSRSPLLAPLGLCLTVIASNAWIASVSADDPAIGPTISHLWRSQNVAITAGSPVGFASVTSNGGIVAQMDFYESADDGGVEVGIAFDYHDRGIPEAFNHLGGSYLTVPGSIYPYAGMSAIARGDDFNELNSPVAPGAMDLQLHPPSSDHNTVAAFVAPMDGVYSVSGLATRRVDANGGTSIFKVFDANGNLLASRIAPSSTTSRQAWGSDDASVVYNVGTLHTGDRIYFAVGADGEYDFDATEIAWIVQCDSPWTIQRIWNSYSDLQQMRFFESAPGYPITGRPFVEAHTTHPEAFNHVASNSISPTGFFYPYAGRSSVERGADIGETIVTAPRGVYDLQLHPGDNGFNAVAAFTVPQTAHYVVSDLGARRIDARGGSVSLYLYALGSEIAKVDAFPDRAWAHAPSNYDLGVLQAGDSIYFAVSGNEDFAFDATEISWKITALAP